MRDGSMVRGHGTAPNVRDLHQGNNPASTLLGQWMPGCCASGPAHLTYASMTSEIWLRNPHSYHREIAEANHPFTVWSWANLLKRRTDPVSFSEMAFGGMAWETLAVGGEGVSHYRPGDTQDHPSAVYPFFNAADDDPSLLSFLVRNPISELDQDKLPANMLGTVRPVPGQEHRVVVGYFPTGRSIEAREYRIYLADLQREHPEVKIHVFGAYLFGMYVGKGIKSVDLDVRERAAHGDTMLPNGLVTNKDKLPSEYYQYFEMFDMDWPKVYNDARYRCLYNIRAAIWAGEYYTEEIKPLVRKRTRAKNTRKSIPLNLPEAVARLPIHQPQTKHVFMKARKIQRGDKLSCNHCTLQRVCKVFRSGSVCTLPNSDGKKLATMFGTRDAEAVIDGLSHLLVMQANRLQGAMEEEEDAAEGLNPEVSKEIKATFENGKTLAQLLNPALKGGPKVINNNNTGPANTLVVANGNGNQLVAGIIRTFEQQGIARSAITPEMISNALAAVSNNKVIEA